MAAQGLIRAEASGPRSEAQRPRSGLGLDAEHGSGARGRYPKDARKRTVADRSTFRYFEPVGGEPLSMANIVIRDQTEADFAAVHELVAAAFKSMPYACGREPFIIDALWRTGAATVALVAEDAGAIVGQAAFWRAKVGGADVAGLDSALR